MTKMDTEPWLVCFDPVADRWNSAGVTGVRGKYKASKDRSCGCKRRQGDGYVCAQVSKILRSSLCLTTPTRHSPSLIKQSDFEKVDTKGCL